MHRQWGRVASLRAGTRQRGVAPKVQSTARRVVESWPFPFSFGEVEAGRSTHAMGPRARHPGSHLPFSFGAGGWLFGDSHRTAQCSNTGAKKRELSVCPRS